MLGRSAASMKIITMLLTNYQRLAEVMLKRDLSMLENVGHIRKFCTSWFKQFVNSNTNRANGKCGVCAPAFLFLEWLK